MVAHRQRLPVQVGPVFNGCLGCRVEDGHAALDEEATLVEGEPAGARRPLRRVEQRQLGPHDSVADLETVGRTAAAALLT